MPEEETRLDDEGITAAETYISVDVETSGPNPSSFSLLSIGACVVDRPELSFYVELKPISDQATEEALSISGLDLATLSEHAETPERAMQDFADWIEASTPSESQPVFVGFNAAFDWMFVCDYFWRFLGRNPFGYTALDIKSFSMPVQGGSWSATGLKNLSEKFLDGRTLTHNALDDARDQAAIFRALVAAARAKE